MSPRFTDQPLTGKRLCSHIWSQPGLQLLRFHLCRVRGTQFGSAPAVTFSRVLWHLLHTFIQLLSRPGLCGQLTPLVSPTCAQGFQSIRSVWKAFQAFVGLCLRTSAKILASPPVCFLTPLGQLLGHQSCLFTHHRGRNFY